MTRSINLHVTSQQGRRVSNEDVELYRMNLDEFGRPINAKYAAIDIFVICDGHGGDAVSKIVAPLLIRHLSKPNTKYPMSEMDICRTYDAVQNKLSSQYRQIASECGCTALVLIRYVKNVAGKLREFAQVINLGDCRAIVSRNGNAIPLTKDHKPYWSDEKKRIDSVNARFPPRGRAQIHYEQGDWRIHDLSVSRSFGDLNATPHVTHIPEVNIYQLQKGDRFMIMACDGLWDVLENHDAVNFVQDHLDNNHVNMYSIGMRDGTMAYPSREVAKSSCIARKLASYAIAKGSSDNVSVFVIVFE